MTDAKDRAEKRPSGIEPETARIESGEAFQLEPGSRIMLEMDCPPLRFWGEFLGMRRNDYLIVSLPVRPDVRDCLLPEQPLTARYLHRDYNICGFQTFVSAVARKPYPLLFLSYPWRMEVINLRHDERALCFLKSSIFIDGEEYSGYMINLSASGARFALEVEQDCPLCGLRGGEEAFCLFRMTGSEEDLSVRGEIKALAKSDARLEFGFRFLEIDPAAAVHIKEYVDLTRRFLTGRTV